MTPFTPSFWVDGYGLDLTAKMAVAHSVPIFILFLQKKYGSRFFLPNRFRSMVFDQFLKSVDDAHDSKALEEECKM